MSKVFPVAHPLNSTKTPHQAVDCLVPDTNQADSRFHENLDWIAYRISDGLKRYPGAPGCDRYPTSLVCAYENRTRANKNKKKDMHVIQELVAEFKESLGVGTSNSTVIAHLRLGDGLRSLSESSARDCWRDQRACHRSHSYDHYYAFPGSWYATVVQELPSNSSIIVLADKKHWTRTKDPRNGNFERDEAYMFHFKDYFEARGHQVQFRETRTPDEDFVYACSAKIFISGGGGFSSLIADVVRANGGQVLKPRPSRVKALVKFVSTRYFIAHRKQKWVLCLPPKTGRSFTLRYLRDQECAEKYNSKESGKNFTECVSGYSNLYASTVGDMYRPTTQQLLELADDDQYEFVATTKHPLLRLRSSFMAKYIDLSKRNTSHFERTYGLHLSEGSNTTYHSFLRDLSRQPPLRRDPHFRPVSLLCGYQFIRFDRSVDLMFNPQDLPFTYSKGKISAREVKVMRDLESERCTAEDMQEFNVVHRADADYLPGQVTQWWSDLDTRLQSDWIT